MNIETLQVHKTGWKCQATGVENISRERATVATYQPRRESENHYRPPSALRIVVERTAKDLCPPRFITIGYVATLLQIAQLLQKGVTVHRARAFRIVATHARRIDKFNKG